MSFQGLIEKMTESACQGDGTGVAACFTPDGIYHDVFYGSFQGRQIIEMIEGYFHRDGEKFLWHIKEVVESGDIGMARYVFSYASKLPDYAGRRSLFEGVAICRLSGGLIADYKEIAEAACGLSRIGFPDARVAKFIRKQSDALGARDEAKAHLGA